MTASRPPEALREAVASPERKFPLSEIGFTLKDEPNLTGESTDGWNYRVSEVPEGDARKLVTLLQDRMIWIGVRAFNHSTRTWMNNNEPSSETVLAWRDLPEPARGRWHGGRFYENG